MRITGGQYRSRKLLSPKSDGVRPTSDKVRAALFNMLNSRGLVQDAVILDAFCGTGALGLEALSHGAKAATFIDKARSSLDIAKENAENLGASEQSHFLKADSAKLKERLEDLPKADLVFLDPPYRQGLCEKAMKALIAGGWLADNAYFVIEMASDETLQIDGFQMDQQKTYGDTMVILGRILSS